MDSNFYVGNPLKLVVWNRNNNWYPTLKVLVQLAPSSVKGELEKLQKAFTKGSKIGESPILKNAYGAAWKSKLGFTYNPYSIFPTTHGGADEPSDVAEFDTLNRDEIDSIIAQIEQEKETEDEQIVESEQVDRVDGIDLDGIDLEPTEITTVVEPESPTHTDSTHKLEFVYTFPVFPDDKVIDFRYKISYHLRIPIFRQHIWYRVGVMSHPLRYRFSYSGASKPVDMATSLRPPTHYQNVAGIPIDEQLYNDRDLLKVEAFDDFTIIGDLYETQGVDTFHMVDLESFVGPRRTELLGMCNDNQYSDLVYYSFILRYYPMLNQAAFIEYLGDKDIGSSYEPLDPGVDKLRYVPKQDALVGSLYELLDNKTESKAIDGAVKSSLTETTLKVNSSYQGKILNFRLLFDLLEATPVIDSIRLYDVWKGSHIIFDKSYYKSKPVTERIQPNTMVFRIHISKNPVQGFYVHLFHNGTYHIDGTWGKDMMYTFYDINHLADVHVTPLINKINSLADRVMYHSSHRLPKLNKSTVKFVDISLSVFWKRAMLSQEFRHLENILNRFVEARIIEDKDTKQKVIKQYYFRRGMYDFDPHRIEKNSPLDNYYAYLFNSDIRKRWVKLFRDIRVFTVVHRSSDIEFSITGIKESEYGIYINCIRLLIHIYMKESKSIKYSTEIDKRETKLLSNLKEQDPQLFDYHKIYNTDRAYSVVCQQPSQPLLLNDAQYRTLDKKGREDIVEYWNFTSSSPAYYRCPNPKYPYLKFIIDKHPLGYCLPCCKKTAPPKSPLDKQRIIYDTCLQDHKYEKKKDVASSSRYIMTYGKPIDPGRISQLPDGSLEPLLSNTRADVDTENTERVFEARYYLYGVRQQHLPLQRIGYLHSVSNALNMQLVDFISKTIEHIHKRPHLFPLLLNGKIMKYFPKQSALSDTLTQLFLNSKKKLVAHEIEDFTMWNELFIDISFYYFKIHSVVFEDRNTVIQLHLPEYLANAEDYMHPEHEHILLLHNRDNDTWYPIYVINKIAFNKNGQIERKLYKYQSETIKQIIDMVEYNFKTLNSPIRDKYTFDILRKYIGEKRTVQIQKILVTRDNLCYGVVIENVGYVPLHMSTFKYSENVDISLSSLDMERNIPQIDKLQRYMHLWNKWVIDESKARGHIKDVAPGTSDMDKIVPMYPLLNVEQWLMLSNRIIGFMCNGMNWYVVPLAEAAALRIARVPIVKLYYNPMDVNRALNSNTHVEDHRTKNITRCLYKGYSYQLLILELTHYFSTQTNNEVRLSLKKEVTKYSHGQESLEIFFESIDKVLHDRYDTHNELINDDSVRLKSLISDILNVGGEKIAILEMIDNEMFNFDKILLESIKRLPLDKLKVKLRSIINNVVHVSSVPKISDFPNILQTCQTDNLSYCRGKRIIVPASQVSQYVDIIAAQIKNPFVQKYIFSPLFIDTIIDYFKFIKRPYEIIRVEYPKTLPGRT
jgi:hypothetical protein